MTRTPVVADAGRATLPAGAMLIGAELGRWGMVLFLVNEATLFACLISSYFYIALATLTWPPIGIAPPSLALPLLMTAALLASSGVLIYAEHAFSTGHLARYRGCVALTIVLGAGFLLLQVLEYARTLGEVSPQSSAYASLFFAITGLHGAHVCFGLLFLIWSLLVGHGSPSRSTPSLTMRNAWLYWHFVDGVWLVILASLYLSPRWL